MSGIKILFTNRPENKGIGSAALKKGVLGEDTPPYVETPKKNGKKFRKGGSAN